MGWNEMKEGRPTRQKLIAQVKPRFCALDFTSVYAKKKAIVTSAPTIMVPRRPQKNLERHMKPARMGLGMELRLEMA
jgi:hypothetical protein